MKEFLVALIVPVTVLLFGIFLFSLHWTLGAIYVMWLLAKLLID